MAILVIGGFLHLPDVEIVSLDGIEECRKPSPMPFEINYGIQGMVGYFDEDEYIVNVCGGETGGFGGGPIDLCFQYFFETDEWNQASFRMKERRDRAASVVLNNGSFFVLGGRPSYRSSEFPIEWKYGPTLPFAGQEHCACLINQTHMFMAGGRNGGISTLLYIDTGEWTGLPNMNEERWDPICQPIKDGREVLAIGGRNNIYSVESFSFDSMSWSRRYPLPVQIGSTKYAVEYNCKESFLIVGGRG